MATPVAIGGEPPAGEDQGMRGFSRQQWYVLCVIAAVYACHALDRAVVGVVIEPMKADLGLDDTGVGMIAGLGYGLAFAVAAVPMGMLVDRGNRVRLLSGMVIVWSACTAAAGAMQSFAGLLLARIGVGAAEAGGQPASLSILSDYFPASRRATALGILYFGAAMGYSISNIVGGVVTQEFGWRAAFFLAGVPGVVLGVILWLTVREPARAVVDRATLAPSFGSVFRHVRANPVILHVAAAMVIASFAITVVTVWTVPLLMREHDFTIAQAGLVAAIAGGVSQAIGAIAAGSLADRLAARSPERIVLVPAIGLALATPMTVAICFVPSPWAAAGIFVLFGLLLSCWTAPGFATILGQLPDRMRGRTMSVIQIGCSFVGASLGPFAAGALSDAIGGPHSLAWAMTLCSLGGIWSAVHFMLGGRAIRRAHAGTNLSTVRGD